ncbi:hypothetical protein OG207_41835 [Streptomyces sp. NBC_01439]
MRTVSAAPSPKYLGFKRGITWLNGSTARSRASGRWSCPAPRATPCTFGTRC